LIPTHGQARQKAEEIKEFLDTKVCGTFPRGVANNFVERFGPEGAAFISDMEAFHRMISDYAAMGGRWLQVDAGKRAELRNAAGEPFFRKFPQHRKLEAELSKFPDLAEVMGLYEAARKRLTALMATIEQVKNR
jgi:hypothetical protein